jgi:2'-5' RNA ligase
MGNQKPVVLNEKSKNRGRFFIALMPPLEVQARATEIKGVMRDRYHSKAAFRSPPHITLLAPFEWPVIDLSALARSLADFAMTQPPVPITLDGFGAFAPHVIYVNVVQGDFLMALQPKLLAHLEESVGLVSERDRNRSFVPHMTVAFRDLKPNMFRQAWSVFQHQEIHFDFTVYQLSLLVHDEQRWQVKENYDFARL